MKIPKKKCVIKCINKDNKILFDRIYLFDPQKKRHGHALVHLDYYSDIDFVAWNELETTDNSEKLKGLASFYNCTITEKDNIYIHDFEEHKDSLVETTKALGITKKIIFK